MTTRNDAEYYNPLTHSLALTNGTGSPTLTRATAMWVFDNEDKLINVPANAAGFGGARVIYNLCTSESEDVTDVNWVKFGGITTPDATTVLCGATTTAQYLSSSSKAHDLVSGYEFLATYRVQYVDIQYVQLFGPTVTFGVGQYANFDLINGDYTATGCTATIDPVSSGVWDISVLFTVLDPSVRGRGFLALVDSQSAGRLAAFTGDGVKSVKILRYQYTDVTGQADQTPGEYVSVGVEAAPYHGAGVDGIKWFNTNKDGTPIPASSLPGLATNHAAITNTMLWCRDFTNPAWVATNVTPTKTRTGLDNAANSCSLLTATANDATILQTITAAAAAGCTGFYVKRSVGTGIISITRDGGSTWTDITSLVNSSTFTLVKIENTSVTNPSVGFKISTSGDAIIVDGGINHLGTKLHYLPILTTSAAVTVGAQTLTYPKTGNIIDAEGTVMATVTMDDWTGVDGGVVGSTTHGLFATATGASAKDGTNTVSGVAGTPTGSQYLGMRWTGSFLQAFSGDEFGVVGSYDGSLNLTTIGIMPGVAGYIKDIAIFQTYVSNADILSILGLRLNDIFNNDVAIAFFKANGFPTEYNDGLLAWLRSFYSVENTTWPLADLLARYLREYGTTFPESVLSEFLLLEDGFKLLQENGFRVTLESSGTIPVATLGPYLLLEDGSFVLQEDNNKFLLEA